MAAKATPGGESLADLAAEGAQLEADAANEAPGTALALVSTPPLLTNEQIIAGALEGGRETFCVFTSFESPRTTLDDEKIAQIASVWGKVCDKRKWDLAKYGGDLMLEMGALYVTWQIAKDVRLGMRAEIAEREAAAKAAKGEAADATVQRFDGDGFPIAR